MEEKIISVYKKSDKIYSKPTKGFFNNWRWIMVWITQIIFYGIPWLTWNNRQAVLFDLEARRFYLFDLVLYPEDFIYLTGLLIISALSLFLFTAVAGRVWCGYACPQTVYTEIFMWIENKIEGNRSARIKLDKDNWNANKIIRKTLKHTSWIIVAFYTGFTFIGYFTPIHGLMENVLFFNLGPWQTFWIFFYSCATWGNAGFMREQVCKHMCPYARFQSAMFDKDTLIITYDEKRGEPRGAKHKSNKDEKLGDCIDCKQCVQVCPVGIDIRKGLQYECISCALCIDACDSMMEQINLPKGLIKYSTENTIKNNLSKKEQLKKTFRPRVLIYFIILLTLTITLLVSISTRDPIRFDIIRDRNMGRIVEKGYIENVYRLQFSNITEDKQFFDINVNGLEGIKILEKKEIYEINPIEVKSYAISVQVPPNYKSGQYPIEFLINIKNKNGQDIELKQKSKLTIPK